jgi:hypothetical protein
LNGGIDQSNYLPIFTIVVNNPKKEPLYDLAEIQHLVGQKQFDVVNQRSRTKLLELGWPTSKTQAFLLSLKTHHFRKHFEEMSAYDGRKVLDADGYKMHFDEEQQIEGSNNDCCFWAKLAVEERRSGRLVAVISIHLDGAS